MPRKPKAPRIYEEHEIGPQHIGRTVHVKNVGKVHVSGLRPSGEPMYHIIEPAVRDAGSYEDFMDKHGLGKADPPEGKPAPSQRPLLDRTPTPYDENDMNWAKNFSKFEGRRGVQKDSPGSWDPNAETQFEPSFADPKSFHGQSGVPHSHGKTVHSHAETIHAPQAAPKTPPPPPQQRGENVVNMKDWKPQPNKISAALDKATTDLKKELKDWSLE